VSFSQAKNFEKRKESYKVSQKNWKYEAFLRAFKKNRSEEDSLFVKFQNTITEHAFSFFWASSTVP
jgi:hypothetical protein